MNQSESVMMLPESDSNGVPDPAETLPPVPSSLDELLSPVPEPEPVPEEAAPPVAEVSDQPTEESSAVTDETPAPSKPRKRKSKADVADEPKVETGDPTKRNWYIVKVQSNREDTIKDAIERRVKIEGLEEFFGEILVPVEKVSELRNGKRVVRTRKMYPGYIMANVEFNDRILYLFRETSGVGDFVGASANRPPQPMPADEVHRMKQKQGKAGPGGEQVVEKIKIPFDRGDKLRVRDGTFAGMEGEVKEIIEPKDPKEAPRVRVELTIFGRPVPVEVEVWQVEQL